MQPDLKMPAGSIVQIDPEYNLTYGGCLLIVTSRTLWGVYGYVQLCMKDMGCVYLSYPWDQVEPTGGKVVWWEE